MSRQKLINGGKLSGGSLTFSKPEKKVNWKKRLWKVFSEYVRRRDKGICFTCGRQYEWKQTHAGHFIPAGISPPPLYFCEFNVHCQCVRCNYHLHGNIRLYSRNLELTYGAGILDELERMRLNKVKWDAWTYQQKIIYYKERLKVL